MASAGGYWLGLWEGTRKLGTALVVTESVTEDKAVEEVGF